MKFFEAVLMLSGMIIGVGMFGIPFSFAQAGFWLGTIELIFLAGIVLLLHLLYAEVVLATPTFHRLPGYIRLYLGGAAAKISWASAFFGIVGTLLAYLILGSVFLRAVVSSLGGILPGFWALILLAAAGAAVTFLPLRKEAFVNGILTVFLIVLIVLIVAVLMPGVRQINFPPIAIEQFFVPYGVLLFALSGGTVIPDVVTVLGRARRITRAAVAVGSLIPALLYFAFAYAVVGVSGTGTSKEAIAGLEGFMSEPFLVVGSVVGLLAVFTSFIVLNGSFQALLRLDLGFSRGSSWLAATAMPLVLALSGFQDFLVIIGAVGSIAIGIDVTLVLAAYHRVKKRTGRVSPLSYLWKAAIGVVMLAGVGYELWSLLV